jgi:hypothetical protein
LLALVEGLVWRSDQVKEMEFTGIWTRAFFNVTPEIVSEWRRMVEH